MRLPAELKSAIEKLASQNEHKKLSSDAKDLSYKYRKESGKGKRLLTTENEAISYSVVRMPATFGAVSKAFEYVLENITNIPRTLLDVGAGTGAASFAIEDQIDLDSVVCLEREEAMQKVGKDLMKESSSEVLRDAKWISYDLAREEIREKADMVVASYMLNELSDGERLRALEKLWNASKNILLLIEPGTPSGYEQLLKARDYLNEKGGYMVAPCPHKGKCLLREMKESDWCHFSCRVERTKLHKQLKDASLGYEDEKFAYMAFSKEEVSLTKNRILRHPTIEKGRISVDICSLDGIRREIITRSDKENFKKVKKTKWGDSFD